MSLGYAFLINLRASEAKREIKVLSQAARRSIGQSTRWARVKVAAINKRGKYGT